MSGQASTPLGDMNTTTSEFRAPSAGNNLLETTISGVCCGMIVYLTICQIAVFISRAKYHEISLRVRKWNELLTASNLPYLMSVALIISALLGSCYIILSIINRHVPFYRPLYTALVCCLMLSFLTMYLVLWLRQTSFYTEPAIRHLTYPAARYISLFHGFYILTGAVVFTVLEVQQVYTCVQAAGCIAKWTSMVITGSQLEVQIALLILFVWPLIKHRQKLQNVTKKDSHNPLMGLIKRAGVITIVSIVIDVVSFGLFIFLKTGTVYNVATVLNLMCTIFCFGNYKARFLPCFITRQASERRASETSTIKTKTVSRVETTRLTSENA